MRLFITRHVPLISSLPPISSTPNDRFDYSQKHTQLFLDQAQANVIGGFMPNTNSPDPNFGKCMQCAAIDRARYKVDPSLSRSSFCTQCFQQYCFDPSNLTSSSVLPNRKLEFVDPDPGGVDLVLRFLSRNKIPIILGFVGLFISIAVLCVFLWVYSGEFSCVCVDSDMVHRLSPVEYGENVGRVRLSPTRKLTRSSTARRRRHFCVTGEAAAACSPRRHRTRPSTRQSQKKNIDDVTYLDTENTYNDCLVCCTNLVSFYYSPEQELLTSEPLRNCYHNYTLIPKCHEH